MQKHIKVYLEYFNLGEQDIITCEACLLSGRVDGSGFDIHHIEGRGEDKDTIDNLMCLCRKHHGWAHSGDLTKSDLKYIHKNYLNGQRKIYA